ncbi:MAG: hypothetical protein AB1705_18850 [Verrucomicrobiota bacterium]
MERLEPSRPRLFAKPLDTGPYTSILILMRVPNMAILAALALWATGALSFAQTNAPAKLTGSSADYRLTFGDKVEFRIEEDPSKQANTRTLQVTALGDIRFPVSLDYDEQITIRAINRTLAEIEKEVKEKLEADYYHKATLHLRWVEQGQRPGRAIFNGSVRGFVPILPGQKTTLMEALMSLNPSEFVNLRSVELNRIDPTTGQNEKKIVDVEDILKNNRREKDVELRDGDLIRTKDKIFNLFGR